MLLRGRLLDRYRLWITLAVVAAAYYGTARLGIKLSVAHGVITPVWAPAGIALAALILGGLRLWPAIAIGAFAANATTGAHVDVAAFIAVGNTVGPVVGAYLLRRAGFRPSLERDRDVVLLTVIGVFAATLSATNGTTALWVASAPAASPYGPAWRLWWLGDAMGILLVTPVLLVWASQKLRELDRRKVAEGVALAAVVGGLSAGVFLGGLWRYPYLIFPPLILATFRFKQLGAATASFLAAALAVSGVVADLTPIGGNPTTAVQILQSMLALVAISLLILAATLSERETAEAALQDALQVRDSILATVSHEVRTPMTSILGFALTLKERAAQLAADTRSDILDGLIEQALKLNRLLTDLLDLERLRHDRIELNLEPHDLGRLVRQVALAYPADGRTIEVVAEPVLADIDPARVERIVENLVANAVKHTPRGTQIRVSVEEDGENSVLIRVDDDGPGVADAYKASIFDLFSRGPAGHEDAGGAGVGLAIVSLFAGLHGGQAWVEDSSGGGASFCVRLPRARE